MLRRTLLTTLATGAGLAAAAPAVRMPAPPIAIPEERQYQRELLRLGLRKAGLSDAVENLPAQTWMRQIVELGNGHADVAPLPALHADAYAGHGLLRVDFPLRLGLLGVRRLLAMPQRAAALAKVADIQTLNRSFTLGYGSDWGDLPTMRSLGVRLRTAPSLPEIYELLRRGEVDYLSRGLNEVAQEASLHATWPTAPVVVPGLVLAYPLDDCYFVTPKRPDLHQALTRGLERAFRDGSYAALLQRHYGAEMSGLSGVRVLPLAGYPAPPGIATERFEAWRRFLPAKRVTATPLQRVVVAGGQDPDDARFRYASRLLALALQRAGVPAELLPRGGITQPRQAAELQAGTLDVGLLPCHGTVRDGQALPVRFPIRRGLLGVRLLLARAERAEAIAAAPDLAALRRDFTMGHGADWGDLALMRNAGFRVVTSDTYAGLFRMLEAGRFDFISRGLSEVWGELASPRLAGGGGLVLVPRLALFYPFDDFLWVNPARPELAEAVATGLERARLDGSFDRLYREHYGDALRRAALRQRKVLSLPGLLPPVAPPHLFDALSAMVERSVTLPTDLRAG